MWHKKNNQKFITGTAALVVGVLGALSALMQSYRKPSWTERAKNAANLVFEKGEETVNRKMLLGGVAGGIIGAVTALLLAPKSGEELIKDLTHPFSENGGRKRSSASRKSASRKRGSSHSAKNHAEGHAHHSSAKKKSSARRRTATARKRATTALATATEGGAVS